MFPPSIGCRKLAGHHRFRYLFSRDVADLVCTRKDFGNEIHQHSPTRSVLLACVALQFALGTAGGDIFLDDLGIPLASTFVGFALALILLAVLWRTRIIVAVLAFWIACVLTRPLGAALGDLLAQPKEESGLGFGTSVTSFVFLAVIAALIAYQSVSKKDQVRFSETQAG